MLFWLYILYFLFAAIVGALMAFTELLDDKESTAYMGTVYSLIGAGFALAALQFFTQE
jgi:hypothetical protein